MPERRPRNRLAPKYQRMALMVAGMLCFSAGVWLILDRFSENMVYFYSPSDVENNEAARDRVIRIGGLVEAGTLITQAETQDVRFAITDERASIAVHYRGLLPNLFREGQGVIAEGTLAEDGVLQAKTILAKHDERYMPPEVADALKRAGRWKETGGKP